jgi:hypothetical protein
MLRASIMSVAWVTLVVPASPFDLVVVNESNYSVLQKLYIAPAKTKNWSDDKLQNQTVGKNGRFTIHDVSKGIYDLKETDDDKMITILVYFQISASIRTRNGSLLMQ